MTRRFDFSSYKIIFNDHHFQGDGYLLGLPRTPNEVYGGELVVSSRPPHLSYIWLLNLTKQTFGIPINGTIEEIDETLIKLNNGVLTRYATGPNSLGLWDFRFYFEVIDPPL